MIRISCIYTQCERLLVTLVGGWISVLAQKEQKSGAND